MHFFELEGIARHGTLWLVLATLGERLGLPLFVTPLLMAAGALAAMGRLHLWLLLPLTTLACLAGDTVWYELGRWKGSTLFGLLCRISWQPDSCVRRTEMALEKHTGLSLLWAKWIPGVAHLALPLAGAAQVPRAKFHLYNTLGSLVWVSALLASGYLSMMTVDWLSLFRITATWIVVAAVLASAVMAGRSYLHRQRFLRTMRMARISAEELREIMNSGKPLTIIDLRHPLDFLAAPRTLPGALRMAPDEVAARWQELKGEGAVVVYCTCPNEASAVKVARQMKTFGMSGVRPLAGGLARWEELGYPVDHLFDPAGLPLLPLPQMESEQIKEIL